MKKAWLTALVLAGYTYISTAQVQLPAPSPTQTTKQNFAIGTIELTYSRPAAKGRKIYGDLVPYDKIWRTGANAATRIVFSDQVEIGGKMLNAGTYVLYTIPGLDTWEVILNKGLNNWGTDGYKETEDVIRFKVEPMKMKDKIESFTMEFSEITVETCYLDIKWDKTVVSIPIAANFRDNVRKAIEAALKTDQKPFWEAAQFYYEYDKDLSRALEYINGAITVNDKAFWMWIYKARIQKDMGDHTGARASSQKSLDLAKAAKNDDYIKLNMDLQKTLK